MTLMVTNHLHQLIANLFAFSQEEYIWLALVRYFTQPMMFSDKPTLSIPKIVLILWSVCLPPRTKMTHIMSNAGMRGSSESIMWKSLVLLKILLVEMIFTEWNSCGSGGLGQSLGTNMGSRGQSCLKSVCPIFWWIGPIMGNPWVIQQVPAPTPAWTRTHAHRYGFW